MDDRSTIARGRMDTALCMNIAGRTAVWHLYRAAWLRVEIECCDADDLDARSSLKFSAAMADRDVLHAIELWP